MSSHRISSPPSLLMEGAFLSTARVFNEDNEESGWVSLGRVASVAQQPISPGHGWFDTLWVSCRKISGERPPPQGSQSRRLSFSPDPQQARKKFHKLEQFWQFGSFKNAGGSLVMNQIVALLWVVWCFFPDQQHYNWVTEAFPDTTNGNCCLGLTTKLCPFLYFLFSSKQQLFKLWNGKRLSSYPDKTRQNMFSQFQSFKKN